MAPAPPMGSPDGCPAPLRATADPDPPVWGRELRLSVEAEPQNEPRAVTVTARATRRLVRPLSSRPSERLVLYEGQATIALDPGEARATAVLALPREDELPLQQRIEHAPALARLLASWLGVRAEPLVWTFEARPAARDRRADRTALARPAPRGSPSPP